jgi:PPOX class probable F420-dependent enzyme
MEDAMPPALVSPVTIPGSHRDLLTGAVHGVLATMMPDGQPQCSVVWVDFDGTHVRLNTTLERQKGRNMCANPQVSLLVVDPFDASRWIEVRGRVVAMRREGAKEHADTLTRRYTSKRHFYGDIYPVEQRQKETRVIVLIEPLKVSLDAIFRPAGVRSPATLAVRTVVAHAYGAPGARPGGETGHETAAR